VNVKTSVTTDAPRPGRQRSVACDDAILDATIDVLCEHGYAGLTVAQVIERSGVSSATLYRRWPTKQQLVLAAVERITPEVVAVDTGSLAGDIDVFLRSLASAVGARREAVNDALTIESRHNEELKAALRALFLAPRVAAMKAILTRAKQRGEIDHALAPELAFSLVVGPLYHRGFVMGEPMTPAFVRAAVAFATDGLQNL
jgi:AcrR family transcriptional regulator